MKSFVVLVNCLLILTKNVIGDQCEAQSFKKLCVTDSGTTVILENEKLSMTITKASGTITHLYYNSKIEPDKYKVNLLEGGSGYYLANIYVNDQSAAVGPGSCTLNIVQNNENIIDLAFGQKNSNGWPVEFEMHLVLEKGASWFYYYSVHRYTQDMPSGYGISGLRWALKASDKVFKQYSIDGKRAGPFPTHDDFKDSETVQDWTYKFKDGSVYSKYQQISHNENTGSVFGVFDDHLGLSMIQAGKEWVVGGPFKQHLTTHPGGVPPAESGTMLLFVEHSGHYGTPGLSPPKGWTKVYGPVAFYLNEGDSASSMYEDAQQQLQAEIKKWPYSWVTAPEYMASSRGSVSGTIKISDGTQPAWTYAILTDPNVDNPDVEVQTYIYSALTSSDGEFTIRGVRPGTYRLHVLAREVVGKYMQDGIKVQANANTDLSTVNWTPESHGRTLWQIGFPDRSSSEFHIPAGRPSPVPNLEEYRKYGTWLSYPKDFPNDVDFTVGTSDASKHWCYFMPMIKTPGFPDQLVEANITMNASPTNWKVRFEYNGSAQGTATLTLGIAASVKGGVRVLMNGNEVLKVDSFEGPSTDSALFRQAAHGIYRHVVGSFSASLLKQGQNLIELTPPGAVSANHFDRMFMWDFIRLESDS